MELTELMLRTTLSVCLCVLLLAACKPSAKNNTECKLVNCSKRPSNELEPTRVHFVTNFGEFRVELLPDLAPTTSQNFIKYVKAGFYDRTIIHKIQKDFVVQMGLYDASLVLKDPILPPIPHEPNQGVEHCRGTVAMVRYQHPDSATSEFLVNIQNNPLLSIANGYTVFGMISDGMEAFDSIASTEVEPNKPLIIYKAEIE